MVARGLRVACWWRASRAALFAAAVVAATLMFLPAGAHASSPLLWSPPAVIDPAPTEHPYPSLKGVSCPSVALCVAVDDDGNIIDSASGTWRVTHAGVSSLRAVSCPSIVLCVAVGNSGAIVSSTNPSGGAGAWSSATLPQAYDLSAVSCPTVSLCAAIDRESGRVFASANPTGGAGAWSVVFADPGGVFTGPYSAVSCPSSSLCVAAGEVMLTSVTPSIPDSWKVTAPNRAPVTGVSCPSASLCVAADLFGTILSSTNPTGGAGAWHAATVLGSGKVPSSFSPTLGAVSCASVSLCTVAVNDASPGLLNSIGECGSARCLPRLNDGGVFVSTTPTGAGSAWSRIKLDTPNSISGLSCPSVSLCAAVDEAGNVMVGAPTAVDLGAPRGDVTTSLMRISRHAGKYLLTTGLTVSCPAQAACTVTGTAVVALSGDVLGRTRTSIPAGGRRSIAFNLTLRTARRLQVQARQNKSIAIYSDLLARTGSGPALAIQRLGVTTG